MKQSILAVLLVLFLASCHTTKHTTSSDNMTYKTNTPDRDGTSYAKAIIIEEKSEMAGVAAEYTWLGQHYPGYKSEGQALESVGKISYDVLTIKTHGGEELKVYFDISNYLGKF